MSMTMEHKRFVLNGGRFEDYIHALEEPPPDPTDDGSHTRDVVTGQLLSPSEKKDYLAMVMLGEVANDPRVALMNKIDEVLHDTAQHTNARRSSKSGYQDLNEPTAAGIHYNKIQESMLKLSSKLNLGGRPEDAQQVMAVVRGVAQRHVQMKATERELLYKVARLEREAEKNAREALEEEYDQIREIKKALKLKGAYERKLPYGTYEKNAMREELSQEVAALRNRMEQAGVEEEGFAVEELRDAIQSLDEGEAKKLAEQRLEVREQEVAGDTEDGINLETNTDPIMAALATERCLSYSATSTLTRILTSTPTLIGGVHGILRSWL